MQCHTWYYQISNYTLQISNINVLINSSWRWRRECIYRSEACQLGFDATLDIIKYQVIQISNIIVGMGNCQMPLLKWSLPVWVIDARLDNSNDSHHPQSRTLSSTNHTNPFRFRKLRVSFPKHICGNIRRRRILGKGTKAGGGGVWSIVIITIWVISIWLDSARHSS